MSTESTPAFETIEARERRLADEAMVRRDQEGSVHDDARGERENRERAERANERGELVWLQRDERELVETCQRGADEIDLYEKYQRLCDTLPRLRREQADRVRQLAELQKKIRAIKK